MEQVRAHSDRTLALIHRTSRRRPGWLFDDRRLDRESAARLLRAHELLKPLKLLKLREIKLFLSKSGLNLATAAQTKNTTSAKTHSAPYTSKNSATIPAPGSPLLLRRQKVK
jgi:hypothetical protein